MLLDGNKVNIYEINLGELKFLSFISTNGVFCFRVSFVDNYMPTHQSSINFVAVEPSVLDAAGALSGFP